MTERQRSTPGAPCGKGGEANHRARYVLGRAKGTNAGATQQHPRTVAVRDSKDPSGPIPAFGPVAWARFADHLAEEVSQLP
ncbi:DUF397 domain-containing protein [Streptomyces sp. MMG1121]|uniref:DUF397 domain-containing protein n=1 Tax=Streptomyces sp. MMG1121 TaxID=1415544 RepID=UPI000A73A7B2|nr:DUF397 domain-containing protein [Streptomyces sp. MMG1121]